MGHLRKAQAVMRLPSPLGTVSIGSSSRLLRRSHLSEAENASMRSLSQCRLFIMLECSTQYVLHERDCHQCMSSGPLEIVSICSFLGRSRELSHCATLEDMPFACLASAHWLIIYGCMFTYSPKNHFYAWVIVIRH